MRRVKGSSETGLSLTSAPQREKGVEKPTSVTQPEVVEIPFFVKSVYSEWAETALLSFLEDWGQESS